MERKPVLSAAVSAVSLLKHADLGHQYALDVTEGRIAACKWVKLACERHLGDLLRQNTKEFPYRFDGSQGGRICRFIEKLGHIKGKLAGTLIVLEPWQCFILTVVWGWLHTEGDRRGKRRFRRAYIEVPRGNAKSTLSSGVGLFMLAADAEGGAECYSAATTRAQAAIVFRDAQHMARRAAEFMKVLHVSVVAHNIHVLRTASKFEALSAEGNTLDGLNIHFGCIDELHAHRDRSVFDALETGTGKREQSLLWCITTAGTNRAGICYEQRTYLTKVLDGVAPDESTFGIIYTIDEDDVWFSEEAFAKANPNWGVSVMPEVIGQLAAKAMQMPAAQNNFRTKHLCVWENADSAWMDMAAWARCGDPSLDEEDFAGAPCAIGLDLATKTDIASKAKVFRREVDGAIHYYAFLQNYLPEAAVTDGRNSQYSGWEIEGRLTVTPGDVLDFEQIEADLIADSSRFQVDDIAYDPWQATQLAQRLQAQGAKVVEFRNTVANFSAPMKEIDALVRSGRFHHNGDPVLTWMVSNVVCHTDLKDNIYPRKERAENKIDGVIALIMALGRAMMPAESSPEYQLLFV